MAAFWSQPTFLLVEEIAWMDKQKLRENQLIGGGTHL